jgi:hypothetical protein
VPDGQVKLAQVGGGGVVVTVVAGVEVTVVVMCVVQGFWLQQVAMLHLPAAQTIVSACAFFDQPLGHVKSPQLGGGVVVTVVAGVVVPVVVM